MKTIFVAAIALAASSAMAMTFWVNGVLYGTICRNGAYFTAYPQYMAQPVGTNCPMRDAYGNIMGYGIVSNE